MIPTLLAATLLAACDRPAPAPGASPAARGTLECKTGPARRDFGGSTWLIYACSDGRSVVITTPADHPAHPFHFMLLPGGRRPQLVVEGYDTDPSIRPAWDAIDAALTTDFAATLHREATAAAAAPVD
ncbi:hypothetical protein [Arenimonas composti]|uniref:Uncharacterized protein n=1 Tax=Arenimonas composti TR7-09 = DSM 18010 TaxID=1121013 RepID=A0A091BCM6_9GAMM|nr:hypothetical protein [Arenimonas composti]KFN49287.1 hypothetical protein P873_11615 [Arenimonas composti TR7-09 = DSM 18010]